MKKKAYLAYGLNETLQLVRNDAEVNSPVAIQNSTYLIQLAKVTS